MLMAISISLDRLLIQRGITLTDLAERVGITLANLSILKTNKGRAVRFSTLDALCRELDCQPGDLLESVPGDFEDDRSGYCSWTRSLLAVCGSPTGEGARVWGDRQKSMYEVWWTQATVQRGAQPLAVRYSRRTSA